MDFPLSSLKALGYQQFAAGGVDTSTALTVPAGAYLVVFRAGAQAIRFRDDGTAPTAAIGFPVPVGELYHYYGASVGALRVIAQVAGATLDVLYYG